MDIKIYLLTFSAKTEESLSEYIRHFIQWLDREQTISLLDLSYSLNARREHFKIRCAFIVQTIEDLFGQLQDINFSNVNSKTKSNFSQEFPQSSILQAVENKTLENYLKVIKDLFLQIYTCSYYWFL